MKIMKLSLCFLFVGLLLVAQEEQTRPAPRQATIQIAILLDTSNSMDGLINQAKSQLWKIVNELATTKKNGKVPHLQVALYEYGKSSLSYSVGHIRMILPLTTDLDKVSEELFALKTLGGQEYCGWAIQNATQQLSWGDSSHDFRAIFIAGNEPFTQGPVPFQKACKAAIEKGIVINTIHCGSHAEGVRGKWQEAALLSDGSYMVIDQNAQVVHIEAPQDKEILALNGEMNKTYIPFGRGGEASQARQMAQDSNAMGVSQESSVQRALSKASVHYRNTSWDLVDAAKEGQVSLEKIKEEELPAEMQKMTLEQRKAYVKEREAKRAEIQEKIKKLNAEREKYVAEQRKSNSEETTLDAVMIKALRGQLKKRNYETK